MNDVLVRWNASTIIDGNLADLRPGRLVRIEGVAAGGEVTANRLTLR